MTGNAQILATLYFRSILFTSWGKGGGGEGGGLGDEEKIFPEKLSQKATIINVKAKKIIMHQDQSQ